MDIGFGDAITPAPEVVTYPTLLDDLQAPTLRAYPVYTVIAEKSHAMVVLGINNSRMKDFFDLHVIAKSTALEGSLLAQAVRATFERRGTPLPAAEPVALTTAFATDPVKVQQWHAFLSKSKLSPIELANVVADLRALLAPALLSSSTEPGIANHWNPVGRCWA